MANISEEKWIEMLEKKADGTFVAKYPKVKSESGVTFDEHLADKANPHSTNKTHVGLGDVDNVKQMPIAGDTFTGMSKAHNNTSYTVAQLRNVILSTSDAVVGSMSDGDIWIKYK